MVCTGMAQMGMVWQAGQGSFWSGRDWRGLARYGRHGSARHSVVGQGRHGEAGHGAVRRGVAMQA